MLAAPCRARPAPAGFAPAGPQPRGPQSGVVEHDGRVPSGVDVALPPAGIVRAWALAHGHTVAPKGRVSAHVVRAYVSEHDDTREGVPGDA
jgi:hypothetical protein